MKKFALILNLAASVILCIGSPMVSADSDRYMVTGKVTGIDRVLNKISVDGMSYKLMASVVINEEFSSQKGLQEVKPELKAGDRVGLVFFTSSTSSSVKEVWILGGSR